MPDFSSDPSPAAMPQSTDPAVVGSPEVAASLTLSDALKTVLKYKWLVLAALLLGILHGFYKAQTQARVYISSGVIEIRSGSSNEYRLSSGAGADFTGSYRIASDVQILKSDTLLLQVARDLDLANDPRFTGHHPHLDLDSPQVRYNVVGQLAGSLNVQVVPKTDLVRIDCTTGNPQISALIINKLVDDFRKRSSDVRIEFTERVSEELTPHLSKLKQKVETDQQRVIELQKRVGVLGFDASRNQVSNTLDDLSRAASQAEIARILSESRYDALTQMDQSAVDSSVDTPLGGTANPQAGLLTTLRTQLSTLQTSYAQQRAFFGPKNPTMVALQRQIDATQSAILAEQQRLIAQARQTYLANRRSEQETNSALDSEKQQAYTMRDDLVAFTLAQREYEADRTLYEGLESRLNTAAISAGLESNEIDVVDRAQPAITASVGRRSSIIILSSFIGLAFGLGLAFLLDALDTKLRSVAEIEAAASLPSLALIPRNRRTDKAISAAATPVEQNLPVVANTKSQFAESFRSLRTSLLLSTTGHPPVVVLVTSATPSEGKTTIGTNLACVMAQGGARTLLIDGDLRRPTVHHRFNINGRVGLTSVLTGAVSLDDAVQRIAELPMLDLLPSGPVPPFPTEMVGSTAMSELIARARHQYTHIIIDSPPILSVTDGVVLTRMADAVVLVVRHGKSSKHVVRRARDLMARAGARLAGVVINAVDLNSPEYYGYYGYYGYSGYSYAGAESKNWTSAAERRDAAHDIDADSNETEQDKQEVGQ